MNGFMKRLICIILTLCLVLQPTLYAQAEGEEANTSEEQKIQTVQTQQVNPLYEGLISEDDLNEVPDDVPTFFTEPEYTNDVEVLGATLREVLKERLDTVTLYVHVEESLESEEYFKQVVETLLAEAFKETSNPDEGDYLRYQYGGWGAEASYIGSSDGIGYDADITLAFTYYTSYEQEEAVDAKLETVLWETLDLDNEELTNYQKTKLIYDYICDNVVYDYTNLENEDYLLKFTAYAALMNGTSVCQGYAVLMYRMMEEAGIDTRIVAGEAGEPHAWNISKLGNNYYYCDSTWDAGATEYNYFLKGYPEFEQNHFPYLSSVVYEDKYANALSATDYIDGESDDSDYSDDADVPVSHVHSIVKVAAKSATCETTGNKEHYKCTECQKLFKDASGKISIRTANVTIPAKGHKYGSYKTIRKATFGTAGEKRATCANSGCSKYLTKAIPAAKTPVLSPSSYTFNNKTRKLSTNSIIVKDTAGRNLSYYVTYTMGKKVGKYAVKVQLTDTDYTGTKTVYYTINPKGVSISKLSKAKKAFTVKWKKPSSTNRKQMTGYQIRYSTSSKMTNAKTVTIKKTTATSKKISKLKAKKYYYVQLRTYKKIGSTYYYSGWSSVKKVKTK